MNKLLLNSPSPQLKWERKDGNLPTGRYVISSDKLQLTIINVQYSDAGVYVCNGFNAGGLSKNEEITVKVECKSIDVQFFVEDICFFWGGLYLFK